MDATIINLQNLKVQFGLDSNGTIRYLCSQKIW